MTIGGCVGAVTEGGLWTGVEVGISSGSQLDGGKGSFFSFIIFLLIARRIQVTLH